MRKRALSLGVLLSLLVVFLVAGAAGVGAQGPLQEDTPPGETWQDITFLHEQDSNRYFEYRNADGDAYLYERVGDTWSDVTPAGPTWNRIRLLWSQGETAYLSLSEDTAAGAQSLIYKLETGVLSEVTPAPPPAMVWDDFVLLEEIDGKGYFSFLVSSGADVLVELDNGTFNVVDVSPPIPLYWTDIAFLDQAGTSRYFRFEDSSGNQHLHDKEAGLTRQAQPQSLEAAPNRTPPGGPWKEMAFLQEQDGKHYFHLEDASANTYLYELDGDTWNNVMSAPDLLKGRCIVKDLFYIVYGDLLAPNTLRYTIHKLENGSLVDKTPLPPVATRWNNIVCLTELDGKGYQAFFEPTAADDDAYLYESDDGTYSDATPADSTWKEIDVLGEPGLRQYFKFTESSSDKDRIYRKSAVLSTSQAQPQQVDSLDDVTPAGTWKHIGFQNVLAGKDYFELRDDSDEAHLYSLDGDTWQDLTPSAATWRSILFLSELGGRTYYEFVDTAGDAHFYEIQDDAQQARLAILRVRDEDLTPSGRWRRMRLLRQAERTADYRFSDDSERDRFFTLSQPGTIIVEAETIPGGGTGFGFSQNMDITGDFSLDGGMSLTFENVVPGSYTVAEGDPTVIPGGYDLTGLECQDSDEQGTDSSEDVDTRTATINLDPGETVTCTFTNTERGKIIIEKETRPGGGSGFGFSQDIDIIAGDFSLDDGQSLTFENVVPGSYTVAEGDPMAIPGGYDLTRLECQDSDGEGADSSEDVDTRTASINLDPGETVHCTFTNTERGKIIVEKETDPGNDPTSFAFSGDLKASLKDGEREGRTVKPGTYTVQETVPTGWALADITCSDGDSTSSLGAATATYRVKAGESVLCTFTNTKMGKITVVKQTVPAGSGQAFTFEGAIEAQLKDDETASERVAAGNHSVWETMPVGWKLTSIQCDDGDSVGDVSSVVAAFRVKPGEHVTCTFTNTHEDVLDPPGTIVVAKQTVPAGDPTLFAFEGDAAGTISDGQRIVVSGLKAGTYTSRELIPEGWILTRIACDDADSSGDVGTATATFRLQPDEDIVCIFTDQRLYPLYLPLVLR